MNIKSLYRQMSDAVTFVMRSAQHFFTGGLRHNHLYVFEFSAISNETNSLRVSVVGTDYRSVLPEVARISPLSAEQIRQDWYLSRIVPLSVWRKSHWD